MKKTTQKPTDNGSREEQPEKKKCPTSVKKTGKRKPAAKSSRRTKKQRESATRALMKLLIMGLATLVLVLATLLLRRGMHTPSEQHLPLSEGSLSEEPHVREHGKDESVEDTEEQTATEMSEEDDTAESSAQSDTPKQISTALYFLYYDETHESLTYKPVFVTLAGSDAYKRALQKLFSGAPSSSLETSIPGTIRVRSIDVENSIAYIDLSDDFVQGAYGDIATARVNQILLTMTHFPGISAIVISVEGKPLETMGDGRRYSWPLRRRL